VNYSALLQPVIYFFAGLVFCIPVALLDAAFELFTLPIDAVYFIIGQLAPLLFNLATELFPVTFDTIPVHLVGSLSNCQSRRCSQLLLFDVRQGLCLVSGEIQNHLVLSHVELIRQHADARFTKAKESANVGMKFGNFAT
jgi:hypothetical protein